MKLKIFLIIDLLFIAITLFATENIAILGNKTISNTTYQNYYEYYDNGGVFVIYSVGDLKLSYVNFISNTADYAGGAIYNNYGKLTVEHGVFKNNNAKGGDLINGGGAIYNKGGIVNLIAKTSNIEFTGNMAGISNAIYDKAGTINLWAGNASIIFNDRIASDNSSSILNINQSSGTLPTTGKVVLNEDMSGYKGTINFYGGTIELGKKGKWFGGNVNINTNIAALNMANNVIQEIKFNSLNVNNELNLSVDADLKNKTMDKISVNSYSGSGKIYIKAINILTDTLTEQTNILFTNSSILMNKINSSVTKVNSKLYTYDVTYNQLNGNFIFTANNFSRINPIIHESAIASSVGGFALQSVLTEQIFSKEDNNSNNKILETESNIEKMLWLKPFFLQDKTKLNNFNIDNNLCGTLAGIDLPIAKSFLMSFYLGYVGTEQKYENIKINQTGYVVGVTGMLIKNSFYLGLTANKIFDEAESETIYGNDSFDINMYSIGAKTGFNCEISDKWILEPNITVMYGKASNQQYRTKQGANINSQSTTNVLVEPQIKAKLGLSNGWQPYFLLGYIANLSDKPKVITERTEFELDNMESFLECGLGINKDFINTPWSFSLQITSRNGFGGNLGIKYRLNSTLEKIKTKKEEKRSLKKLQEQFEEEEQELEEMEMDYD